MHPSATIVSRAVAVAIEWAGMDDWVGECMVLESAATVTYSDSSSWTVHLFFGKSRTGREKARGTKLLFFYLLLLPPNNAPKA